MSTKRTVRFTRFAAPAMAGLLVISGCAHRRGAYQAPVSAPLQKAETWNTTPSGGAAAVIVDEKELSQWWRSLGDPLLTTLEEKAIAGNLDLRKAASVVQQAKAQRNVAAKDRLPTVNLSGSVSGSRNSSSGGFVRANQTASAQLDASWEPDLFNKYGNTIRAYDADLASAQEDLRNVLVSLTAELAINYLNVRSYQSQLALTQASLESQQKTYELTRGRFESGLATELDVQQALANVESTRAGIPTLQTSLQQAKNAIAVLTGDRPGAVDAELAQQEPVPTPPAQVAVGLPSDLIRRRPDIRSAERKVAAQWARVNVTRASLYPSFTISGTFGLNALSFVELFTSGSFASTATGAVQQLIFDGGKVREQIKVQDALLGQAVTTYESTVLTAIQDVEDALQSYAQEQVRQKTLTDAVAAADRAATLSTELYSTGLQDFLTVLDTQRTLLTLRNQLAQSQATTTSNLVRLYKAIGGGWDITSAMQSGSSTGKSAAGSKNTIAVATTPKA